MRAAGQTANRRLLPIGVLTGHSFFLNSRYQLLAALYFHRHAEVAQRVGGLRLFAAIILSK